MLLMMAEVLEFKKVASLFPELDLADPGLSPVARRLDEGARSTT